MSSSLLLVLTLANALWIIPFSLSIWNLLTWSHRTNSLPKTRLDVSVLIPARNEQENIGALIQSILQQTSLSRVSEIIVYDDHSTDQTPAIVTELAKTDARIRLISGQELPHGWLGKPHACQRLYEASKSSLLLFLDADVRLKPQGLDRLVSWSQGVEPNFVVTAVPRQIAKGFLERLMIPLLHVTYLSWLPLRWANRSFDPALVAACGQVLLASRDALQCTGGFISVRSEIVDDVKFCRHARLKGCVVVFADGHKIATCRMYTSSAQLWAGFSKNLYLGLGTPWALALAVFLYLAAYVLPYITSLGLALSPLSHSSAGSLALVWLQRAAWWGIAANVSLRGLLCLRYRQSWLSVMLHPVGVLSLVALAINSALWARSGRIAWSGRVYRRNGELVLSKGSLP